MFARHAAYPRTNPASRHQVSLGVLGRGDSPALLIERSRTVNGAYERIEDGTAVNTTFRHHPHYAKLGEIGKRAMTAILSSPDVCSGAPDLPAWVNAVSSNSQMFWSKSYPNLCVQWLDWQTLHVFREDESVEICEMKDSDLGRLCIKVMEVEYARKEAVLWSHLSHFIS